MNKDNPKNGVKILKKLFEKKNKMLTHKNF